MTKTGASRLLEKAIPSINPLILVNFGSSRQINTFIMRDLHMISIGLWINWEFEFSMFGLSGTHLYSGFCPTTVEFNAVMFGFCHCTRLKCERKAKSKANTTFNYLKMDIDFFLSGCENWNNFFFSFLFWPSIAHHISSIFISTCPHKVTYAGSNAAGVFLGVSARGKIQVLLTTGIHASSMVMGLCVLAVLRGCGRGRGWGPQSGFTLAHVAFSR